MDLEGYTSIPLYSVFFPAPTPSAFLTDFECALEIKAQHRNICLVSDVENRREKTKRGTTPIDNLFYV